MLKEAKRLHALGFALHWCRPNSKAPVEARWTSGDRKSWDDLKAAHSPSYNMGVRLGAASRLVCGNYLAVVDCDVKSKSPAHVAEMEKELAKLVVDLDAHPTVTSGRGNGSRHIYAKLTAPVKPFRFAQSSEKVRVKMPSVKPSGFEKRALSGDEIRAGWRLRAAWEISVMGEGQQVVLPPSIHPDTLKKYAWSKPVFIVTDIPAIEIAQPEKKKTEALAVVEFEVTDFDALDLELRLGDKMARLIVDGDGCSDRSAGLMSAALAMCRAEFTDNEVLSVLTDEGFYLGGAAYEHTGSKSRKTAANWIRKYTLTKARENTSVKRDFADIAISEEVPLDAVEADEQKQELSTFADWRTELQRSSPESGAKIKNTMKNVYLILVNEVSKKIFGRDELAVCDYYLCDTPWEAKKGDQLSDQDIISIKFWLATEWGFEPSNDRILEAILKIAYSNRFHPVRDYLSSLEWDGVERVGSWLREYISAKGPERYLSEISEKVLVGAVARIFEPGVKYDQVLILEGEQGCGKSSTVSILGGRWFTDAPINVKDKDAVLNLRGKWFVEIGELSAMSKSDTESFKAFVTQQRDRIRDPYGRIAKDHPRQCVFFGTTNKDQYLKDPTGARRYWPVKVGQCSFDKLIRDRDQIFAEAVFIYQLQERMDNYFNLSPTAKVQALEGQKAREVYDELEDVLRAFFDRIKAGDEDAVFFNIDRFSTLDLYATDGPFSGMKYTPAEGSRVSGLLRHMGFHQTRVNNARVWSALPLNATDLPLPNGTDKLSKS